MYKCLLLDYLIFFELSKLIREVLLPIFLKYIYSNMSSIYRFCHKKLAHWEVVEPLSEDEGWFQVHDGEVLKAL